MDENTKKWEDIYREGLAGSHMRYPSENLVTLFFQNRKHINTDGQCLDYGFGSANNSEFLIQHMAALHGVEISDSSVEIAKRRLADFSNFEAGNFIVRSDLSDYQERFDLIVAWQMLCYNDQSGLETSISNMLKCLKPGGILLCTLTTQRDIKTKFAKKLANNTFIIDERIPHQEGCMIYSPPSEKEFLAFFNKFEILDSGYFERLSTTTDSMASEYYLAARKS